MWSNVAYRGGRVLVVGVSKWLKNKSIRGNRPDIIKVKWRYDRGYVFNFRRRVVRVLAQMACRANSQSGKHCPLKPSYPWRDANRWTCSRHYVPVSCPTRFTERCCCCTCCRKHGRWRPEYLEGVAIIQHSPPQGQAIFWLSLQKIIEATLWVRMGLRKEHEIGGKGAGHNFWKNDIAQGHSINWLKSNGSKVTNQIQLNLDPQSSS